MEYSKEVVLEELKKAHNLTELVEIKNRLNKQIIAPMQQSIATLTTNEEKKACGLRINQIKELINALFVQVKEEKFVVNEKFISLKNDDAINNLQLGHEHILTRTNLEILSIFKRLGFDIRYGGDVMETAWNFDALNIPETHPARAMHDSFFFDPFTILKTHNTSWSAKYLAQEKDKNDIRICTWGPVYRNDDDDATHSHQFMQIDMVWVKEGLNIANLKWLVDYMLKSLFGESVKTRYRLSFFPFTEPSFEVDVSCFNCDGSGCNICKHTTWIEVLGAGVLHKNVLKNVGIDANKYSGIAFGLGIERIAMLKNQIEDIRNFYLNDFNFLKQFK